METGGPRPRLSCGAGLKPGLRTDGKDDTTEKAGHSARPFSLCGAMTLQSGQFGLDLRTLFQRLVHRAFVGNLQQPRPLVAVQIALQRDPA